MILSQSAVDVESVRRPLSKPPRFDAAPAADDGHFAKHGPDVRGFPPSRTGLFASHPSVTEPATTGTDGRLTPRAPRDGCGETQCRAPRDWA